MRHRCIVSFLLLVWVVLSATVSAEQAIPNWPAPPSWGPTRSGGVGGAKTLDLTNPLPLVPLAPCRIVDTRGNGAPISGGIFTGGADVRNYAVSGICGIPASARALSLNFTVTGPGQTSAGFLVAWPTGGAVPPVSILNWDVVPKQIANAAVVPTNTSVSFTVNVSAPTHVIIDVNGYYSSAPATSSNFFKIVGSGPYAIWGDNTSATDLSTGVYGVNEAATGVTVGVWGRTTSSTLGAIGTFGDAIATSGVTYGVAGLTGSSTAGAAGVHGEAFPTTGVTYGVVGYTRSTSGSSAGVYGIDGSGEPTFPTLGSAGVRGGSAIGYGVIGVSGDVGVFGVNVDSTGSMKTAGYLGLGVEGVFYQNGLVGTGTKSFIEPHPTDASKVIRYVSLEGPEAGTYFRGRGRFQRGFAAIELPEDFRMVTDPESLSIQVTPIGEITGVAVVRIGSEGIIVKGSRDVEFFYTVNGVRRAYNHWNPIQPNEKYFVPESPVAKLPKYLSEEETRRLIANGTYNADGTVNMETAERVGWTRMWADREARARDLALRQRTITPSGK